MLKTAEILNIKSRPPKIGLVLGSGAARGWAHIGVIQALEEADIGIDIVSGSSAGAMVGAFYASDKLDGLIGFSEEFSKFHHNLKFMDFAMHPKGLMEGNKFIKEMSKYLDVRDFEELRIPFGITVTDLKDLSEVHISSGPLLPAIRASVSVPGFVKPLEMNDRILVDGGVLNALPVNLARSLGADIVIAVDISSYRERVPGNAWDVMNRSVDAMMHRINVLNKYLEKPEIVIQPDLNEVNFFGNHLSSLAIERGYVAAREAIPQIKQIIGSNFLDKIKKAGNIMKTKSLARLLKRLPVKV